jgi:hypothetical protein
VTVLTLTADGITLRDAFRFSNMTASQRALWCSDYPGAEPNTCRYCGKHWRQWAGSKLDGHAACIVTEDFKQRLAELFRASPGMTYTAVASAIGVSPSVLRSWIYPIRSAPQRSEVR